MSTSLKIPSFYQPPFEHYDFPEMSCGRGRGRGRGRGHGSGRGSGRGRGRGHNHCVDEPPKKCVDVVLDDNSIQLKSICDDSLNIEGELLSKILQKSECKVHVVTRPRMGEFFYENTEFGFGIKDSWGVIFKTFKGVDIYNSFCWHGPIAELIFLAINNLDPDLWASSEHYEQKLEEGSPFLELYNIFMKECFKTYNVEYTNRKQEYMQNRVLPFLYNFEEDPFVNDRIRNSVILFLELLK